MRVPFEYTSRLYDNAEFTIANGISNYDVASNQNNLFGGVNSNAGKPVYFVRIVTDQTITIKINSTGNDAITITSAMSPFIMDEVIEVDNIYITNNSGSTANIKVLTAKPVEK